MTLWDAIIATFAGLGSPLAVVLYGVVLLLAAAGAGIFLAWATQLDVVEALVRTGLCLVVAFFAISLIVWGTSAPTALDWSVA